MPRLELLCSLTTAKGWARRAWVSRPSVGPAGSDSRASDRRKQCRLPLWASSFSRSDVARVAYQIRWFPAGCLVLPHTQETPRRTPEPESRAVTTRHFGRPRKVWRSTPTRLIPGRPNVIQLSPSVMMCGRRVSVLSHYRALFP